MDRGGKEGCKVVEVLFLDSGHMRAYGVVELFLGYILALSFLSRAIFFLSRALSIVWPFPSVNAGL